MISKLQRRTKTITDFDPSLYTVEMKRISTPEGMLYEAKVKEVPGVAGYAECAADAFEETRNALEMLHELAIEQGREFPTPLPMTESAFNGRVTLRMSKSLHRQATLIAEHEGVSLNSIIAEAFSERVFGNHRYETSFKRKSMAVSPKSSRSNVMLTTPLGMVNQIV